VKRFRIEVPGSVVIAGVLGFALEVTGLIEVTVNDEGGAIEGDEALCAGYRAFPAAQVPGACFSVERAIPEGLGPRTGLTVAALAAAAAATETKEARATILNLAVQITGDAARATAALMGGVTVGIAEGDHTRALYIANHVSMGVVLFQPETDPPLHQDPLDPARLAYLTTALIWGRWEALEAVMTPVADPSLDAIMAAAREAGAYGAFAGLGSLTALTPPHAAEAVLRAMESRAAERSVAGNGIVASVREAGVTVTPVKDEKEAT
jgi:hypothetical protein